MELTRSILQLLSTVAGVVGIVFSGAYDYEGWQPAFQAAIPTWTVDMFMSSPFAEDYKKLAADPDAFPAMA